MIRIRSGRTLVNYLQMLLRTRLRNGASVTKFGGRRALEVLAEANCSGPFDLYATVR